MEPAPRTLTVTSPAFAEGGTIPQKFTCDGTEVSPPLQWSGIPDEAASLALVVDDPDAPGGTFLHWTLFGMDPSVGGLEEGTISDGALEGINDSGRTGYGGPCPPRGDNPHRYVFTVYALSSPIEAQAGAAEAEVRSAIAELAIAEGRLTGTYGR